MTAFFKRWTSAAALALAGVVGVSAAQANLLTNPGFETEGVSTTDAAAWSESPNGHTAIRSTETPHSGQFSFKFAASSNPSATNNNANVNLNNVPVGPIAWQTVTLSGWARHNSSDPMIGGTQRIEFRIYFNNSSGGTISFITKTILAAADPTGVWKFDSLSGIAPTGTEKLTAQAIFRTDAPNRLAGSALVDDMSLTVVPEPAGLMLLGAPALLLRRRRR